MAKRLTGKEVAADLLSRCRQKSEDLHKKGVRPCWQSCGWGKMRTIYITRKAWNGNRQSGYRVPRVPAALGCKRRATAKQPARSFG